MTSSISYGIVTLTIDGVTSFLQLPDVQNVRKNTRFSLNKTSLQCYSVLSDILVKNELCIPLERGSNVLSTGEGFICLSPTSKR